ncbi:MAG: hypothetical protein D6718_11175 [Acidobacteria bacterium]|nr:MAG: hypothetical protein D6718_11175 [Acidobacteriota bacterium]
MRRYLSVRWTTMLLGPAVLAAAAAGPAAAQDLGLFGWGIRGGLSASPDQLFVGAHLEMGEVAPHLFLRPNLEIGAGDDETDIALQAGLHYELAGRVHRWTPYAGGELGIVYRDFDRPRGGDTDDTGLALNAVAGLQTGLAGGDRLFFEAKVGLAEKPRLKLLVGWTF